MSKKYKAIALFSGGLDSVLSVIFMQRLGYEVIPIFFETPFFSSKKALKIAKKYNIDLKVVDISERHMDMLLAPKYGYGKFMNPCIDCHGLMMKVASEKLEEWGADFIISGEVLGQRPMSQRKNAMRSVSKISGVKDLIVRPLSQKLLDDTLPIREGWVKKEEMLDIQGRTRQRQLELAEEFGVTEFYSPGGGCLLTEKVFSRRLKDLIEHNIYNQQNIHLLKVGRHLRLNDRVKLIIGRKRNDNDFITEVIEKELVLKTKDFSGPLGVLISEKEIMEEDIRFASSILLKYNNKAPEKAVVSYGEKFHLENDIEVFKIDEKIITDLMI